jgi:hypothetical protein
VSLSSAEREALDRLIPRERQTGDLEADLIAAGLEAKRRREQNTEDGGHVFAALTRATGSLATTAYLVKLPKSTIARWSKKPGETDAETPAEGETP